MSKRKFTPRKSRLRRFNNFLTVAVMLLGFYIIALPFTPYISFWVNDLRDSTDGYKYQGQLASDNGIDSNLAPPPEDNTLVIPSLRLNEPVMEGGDITVIGSGGTWRRPNTSTPNAGSNTVLVAHRFSYSEPSTFFHLDKMEVGDVFEVWWQQKEYIYKVKDVKVVQADAIEVEGPTESPTLTLYTCTPVWTAKDRLVIVSELVNKEALDNQTQDEPQEESNDQTGDQI